MKTLHILALLATSLHPRPAAAQAIHSHLFIPVNKQFVLGGDQPGTFRVSGKNVGAVAVEVSERFAKGTVLLRGRLLPGERTQLQFEAGSTALLRNEGSYRAVLDLDITGSHPGRMTYEPAASAN